MTRTALPKPEQVPADSKPTLDAFTKNIGFTPNMMATFAQSPIAFNSWAALLGSLSKALDMKTRDSIDLAVSEGRRGTMGCAGTNRQKRVAATTTVDARCRGFRCHRGGRPKRA